MTTTDEKLKELCRVALTNKPYDSGPDRHELNIWLGHAQTLAKALLDRLSGESALRARVKELEDDLREQADFSAAQLLRAERAESALALALKSRRTPGTISVCRLCHTNLSNVQERGCQWTATMRGGEDCPIVCSVLSEIADEAPQQEGSGT